MAHKKLSYFFTDYEADQARKKVLHADTKMRLVSDYPLQRDYLIAQHTVTIFTLCQGNKFI